MTQPKVRMEKLSLLELFSKSLVIPEYQRFYSWGGAHVQALLKDIFGRSTPYLMGTIILHEENGKFEIVDGQQRLVTLTILCQELCRQLGADAIHSPLLGQKFSEAAQNVIRNTQKITREYLLAKTKKEKETLLSFLYYKTLDKIEKKNEAGLIFMVLQLEGENSLDLAYTFFDSVNSKGMTLTDFDLLKAHHLIFIPSNQETLATTHNKNWQDKDGIHPHLFSTILRRIRMWARGNDRDKKQDRPDYNEFCSVVEPDLRSGDEHMLNRYMQPVAFRSWRRVGEKVVLTMDYPASDGETLIPTEITQTIEGGDPFFLFTKRYHSLYKSLFIPDKNIPPTEVVFVRDLARAVDNVYLRNAFQALILLYYDKFGGDRLIENGVCLERIISTRRWEALSVRIEGTLTHVRSKRLVPIILEAVNSRHVYAQLLPITQTLTIVKLEDLEGARKQYFNSLQQFYRQAQSRILDRQIQIVADFYLGPIEKD